MRFALVFCPFLFAVGTAHAEDPFEVGRKLAEKQRQDQGRQEKVLGEILGRIEDRLSVLEYHLTPKTRTPADGERLFKHNHWWRYNTVNGRYEPEGDGWREEGGYWYWTPPAQTFQQTPRYGIGQPMMMQTRGARASGNCAGGT
jgi:hypothetical protein